MSGPGFGSGPLGAQHRAVAYRDPGRLECGAAGRQPGGFSAYCGASPPISSQLALYATWR